MWCLIKLFGALSMEYSIWTIVLIFIFYGHSVVYVFICSYGCFEESSRRWMPRMTVGCLSRIQIGVPNGARPLVLILGTCSRVVCRIAQDFASSALQCQASSKPMMLGPITWWKNFMGLAYFQSPF
jgi:hypothetical protein